MFFFFLLFFFSQWSLFYLRNARTKIGEGPPIRCGDILILVARTGIYSTGAKIDDFFKTFFFFAQWSPF
jgi:hypothetical protein